MLLRKLKDITFVYRHAYPEVLMSALEKDKNHVYLPTYYEGKNVCYAFIEPSFLKEGNTYYELLPNHLNSIDSAAYYALILNSGVFKTYMGSASIANRRILVKTSVLGDFDIPYFEDVELQNALVKVEKIIEHLLWCHKQGLSLSYAELKMSTFELLREALVWSLYCEPIMENHQLHILLDWKQFCNQYDHISDINAFVDEVLQQFIIHENPLKAEMLMVSYIESELKSYYKSRL